jgi:hypothetical protein
MNNRKITPLASVKLKDIMTVTPTEIVADLSVEQKDKKLAFIMATIKKLFVLRGYENRTEAITEISNQLFDDGFKAKAVKLACEKLAKDEREYLNYPVILKKVLEMSGSIKETFYRSASKKVQTEIQAYVNSHQDEIDRIAQKLPREDLLKEFIAVKEEQENINKKYGDDPAYKSFKQALSKGLGYALDGLIDQIKEFRKQENI